MGGFGEEGGGWVGMAVAWNMLCRLVVLVRGVGGV